MGLQSQQIPLNTLRGARVERNRHSDGNTYRVIIRTSTREVPFTQSFSSGESNKQAIASQIEEFVKNPQMLSLKQEQDERLWIYLFGSSFVIIGFLVLLAPVVTCVFDKTLDTLTLRKRGLFGTKIIERRISEIKDVLVEKLGNSEDSTYRVSIILVGGERLPITLYYVSGRKSKQETASHIKSFLNLDK